jgi:hypothetical protein
MGTIEHRTKGSDSGATYGRKALRKTTENGGYLDGKTAEHWTKRRGDRYNITVNKTRR